MSDGTMLVGSYRAIYKYFFDTVDPSQTPWEMFGFSENLRGGKQLMEKLHTHLQILFCGMTQKKDIFVVKTDMI